MMGRWVRRISLAIAALIALACAVVTIDYVRWSSANRTPVIDVSTVVPTSRGLLEYAELGRGPPMLMIHGGPGGFDVIYKMLQRQYGDSGPPYRAIIPSRPGYLRTPLSTGRTPAEQADVFAALLDSLGERHAFVYGISDGGPSALQFALRHVERCSGLIVVSAVTQRVPPPPIPRWLRIVRRVMPGDFEVWLFSKRSSDHPRDEAHSDPRVLADMTALTESIAPFAPRIDGLRNDDFQDSQIGNWPLRNITCPTLVIHGTADEAVPPFHGDSAATIPGARLVRIDGAGHMAFITHRPQVDAAIAAFLAEHAN